MTQPTTTNTLLSKWGGSLAEQLVPWCTQLCVWTEIYERDLIGQIQARYHRNFFTKFAGATAYWAQCNGKSFLQHLAWDKKSAENKKLDESISECLRQVQGQAREELMAIGQGLLNAGRINDSGTKGTTIWSINGVWNYATRECAINFFGEKVFSAPSRSPTGQLSPLRRSPTGQLSPLRLEALPSTLATTKNYQDDDTKWDDFDPSFIELYPLHEPNTEWLNLDMDNIENPGLTEDLRWKLDGEQQDGQPMDLDFSDFERESSLERVFQFGDLVVTVQHFN
jgi:hypothetical protein